MGQSVSLEDSEDLIITDNGTGTNCNSLPKQQTPNTENVVCHASFEPGAAPIHDNEYKVNNHDKDCLPPGMQLSPPPPLPFISHPQPSLKNMSNKFKQC